MHGHQVNVGFRNHKLFVQAVVPGTVLEYVPYEVFGELSDIDLPTELVENCIHWLDIRTGIMEIRQPPDIWSSKAGNWVLDFNARKARRRQSSLVDPHSRLFQQFAHIFDRFEDRGRVTVFQPDKGPLQVQLRRLELSFFVNPRRLLQCRQLRAEIDLDQDAGTWYGLNSKLVLRDAINPCQRSIIVPIGPIRYKRNGFHVAVDVGNDGTYGRFTINDVLGRLDCPTEPKILYSKAQFHAYTSSVVPDPLTGRTGAEEALHFLKSGYCQPWTPLNPGLFGILTSIADLTPRREYYPQDMKTMQRVFWDPHLTTSIQRDGFRPILDAICGTSKKLSVFAITKADSPLPESARGPPHLLHRSYSRYRVYQRPDLDSDGLEEAADLAYKSRDRDQASQACRNVLESTTLIRRWSAEMPTTSDLAGILQNWPIIGGYDGSFDKHLISDRINVRFDLEWGSLVNLCRASGPQDMYQLMFLFAVISFDNAIEMSVVRTLIAFMISEDLKALDPPKWPSYLQFRQFHYPSAEYLMHLIKPCFSYPDNEEMTFPFALSYKERRKREAAKLNHEEQAAGDCKTFAKFLLDQWPCPEPVAEGFHTHLLVDVPLALQTIMPEWLRLFQNMELSHHVQQVQCVLDRHSTATKTEMQSPVTEGQDTLPTTCRGGEIPGLSQDLLRKTCPLMSRELLSIAPNGDAGRVTVRSYDIALSTTQKENLPTNLQKPLQEKSAVLPSSQEIQELQSIVDGMIHSHASVHQQYGQELMQSLEALKIFKSLPKSNIESILPSKISTEILRARESVHKHFEQLRAAFERNDSRASWLKEGGLWPCITPVTLLEQLRSTSTAVFGVGMKETIVSYAVSITVLQRLLRINDAYLKDNMQILREEQQNLGHENWAPLKNPDWLLLEIDGNILIRPDQVDVALATISPDSRLNSVLQMNMGQGKTSCIMPMVAAVLADTRKLLRVIVPKALLLQTAQLLQARLGGLLGREVRHIPFSRKTPTNSANIKAFFNIQKEIRVSSGVIVALPEHILSFMLSGVQRLSDERIPEATQMVKVQSWMRKVCRDVLDECDFTLAVRTQLIYPPGSQTMVDGHPHRWETAEALLRLVEGHLWNLRQDFPHSIEVVPRAQGGFPMVFFLRRDVEDALMSALVKDILRGQTSIIPTRECTQSDRLAIKQFISDANVRPATAERIRQLFPDRPAAQQNLHLLRGLLVHRILLLALKKRWNVQYGLHPNRDPIAVPFHAKGVPSEQAEWGHPDVAILFTCLAFYYGGLDLAQLRQSVEHVVKSDDPASEYDRWVHSSQRLPDSLRDWNVINVDDETQQMEIWQHLRYKVVVIDHFLNHFVFPKHAKQFRMKLQASGWDLPLFSPGIPASTDTENVGNHPQSLTTGFSGTNDNRAMLPLTIKQQDLRGLSHTNAEVLTYLLQPQSRKYVLTADGDGRHLSELELLGLLHRMGIRMLIDAGAQILEMDNISLARAWLKIDYEAPAAVYFDAENKPFVVYRHGSRIPLSASPFSDNLGDCLVYLDEAHTRGTDLKMPADAVGALTLGLGQTKDQTVQAAMRLRQLATSQSVVFFAPPEVHQSICDLRKKKSVHPIDSHDVICWLLEQTCNGIEQMQPLYFSQGVDFCRRTQAALDNPDMLIEARQRQKYLDALRQSEKQTLKELYKPRLKSKRDTTLGSFSPEIAAFTKELHALRKGFKDNGTAVHSSALQEVEQEREVAHEVETVREVQKPVHYSPMSFSRLHTDIITFVETGRLAAGSEGCEHAFVALRRTALGLKHGIGSKATASKLFVSKEFTRTVHLPRDRPDDNYLRQVNWILWSPKTETALVVIPEEAELLFRLVQDTKNHCTHLLTYAAPVTRKMLHFNNLGYYAVPTLPTRWKPPTWLTIELGIFAGRLYFEFEEYDDLRRYLGFHEDGTKHSQALNGAVESIELLGTDGGADDRGEAAEIAKIERNTQTFTASPLTFLQEWLAVRRKGQDFTHTPMGYLCQGKTLTANHPFFTRLESDGSPKPNPVGVRDGQGWKRSSGVGTEGDMAYDEEVYDDDVYFDEGA